MKAVTNARRIWLLCAMSFALVVVGIVLSTGAAQATGQASGAKGAQAAQADPWTSDQTVDPATLAKEISGPPSQRPTIVSVSPHALYLGGHIPGAMYQGPGFSSQAIEGLKRWAERLPRGTDLVVYCGCCPLVHCPNLRPAFRALQSMGFTHLRALILPTNFYTDWYAKGYPTEKGS
jgi:thiosulfate/3-mercaptopyruvate sulfurtransferase